MKRITLLSFLLIFLLQSCDVLQEVAKTYDESGTSLTEQEVVKGLKEALKIGTNNSVFDLSKLNGFYGNQLLRIGLPPEANVIVQHKNHALLKAAGITDLINDSELRLNRAAEDAVKSAKPIFANAITSMTIHDAFGILNGNDTAATHYFRKKTYHKLKNSFKPKIKFSLDKSLVGSISANEGWESLTTAYNGVAAFTGWKKVNTQLDEYVTQKALNGLFKKLGEEEKKIRKDPAARVTDILEKVFGSL